VTAGNENPTAQALLDQQRVLAEFGEFALRADDLDAILDESCRLVGRGLRTDLAKVAELLPDGKGMLVRAGVGWKPGVVRHDVVPSDENTPEGVTVVRPILRGVFAAPRLAAAGTSALSGRRKSRCRLAL
jgi:hypothetical protein